MILRHLTRLLLFNLILAASSLPAGESLVPVRTGSVLNVPLIKAPVIDGVINAAEYADAQPCRLWGARKSGVVTQTEGWVGRNATHMYLAVRCFDSKLDDLVSGNDALWQNDCVEFFLDVDKKKLFFAHLVADCSAASNGDIWVPDEWGEPTRGPKAPVIVKSGREKKAWTVEIAVPIKAFGVKITDKSVWSLGFCREKKTDPRENSSFLGWFNRYATWPDLTFDKRRLVVDGAGLRNISDKPIKVEVIFEAAAPADEGDPVYRKATLNLTIPAKTTTPLDWATLMTGLEIKPQEEALFRYEARDGAAVVTESYRLAQKKEPPKPVDPNKVPEANFVKSVLDDPNFWPIAVWAQPAGTAEKYKAAGVNIYVGGSDSYPSPRDIDFMNAMSRHGMYTMLAARASGKWGYYFKPGKPKVTEGQIKDPGALLKRLHAPASEVEKGLLGVFEEKDFLKGAVEYMNKRKGQVNRNHIRALADQLTTVVEWKNLSRLPAFARAMAETQKKYPDFSNLSKGWRNRRILEAALPDILNSIPMLAQEHPAFLGWFFGDEPDNATTSGKVKHTPQEIFADFVRLRNIDNRHPIFLNLGCGVAHERFVGRGATDEMYPEYAKACDILCYDVYPCNSIQPNGPNRLHLQGKGVKRLRKWAGPTRKVWTWIEVNHFSKGGEGREPTHDEIKTQHWMAIVHGANGHGYFCHSWSKKFLKERMGSKRGFSVSAIASDTLKALADINREIKELAPVLNSPTIQQGTATMKKGRRVDYLVKQMNGATYLFAVNMYREPATATFTVKAAGDAQAEVLYENRTAEVKGGSWTVEFAPYAVHRYKISK